VGVPATIHRAVRALTGWYPYKTPAYELNVFLSWIGFDSAKPRWMEVRPRGQLPGIALNVSIRYHRKNYYFLKAYYRQARRAPLARFLEQTLQPGDIFLDIGAHIGFFSFLASRLVGADGRVYAFEPDPLSIESLTRSAALNSGNVQVCPIALSDAAGVATLHRAIDHTAHSLVEFARNDPRDAADTASVQVTTLDTWAAEHQLDAARVRVIKVDVEGAEPRTIAGALGFLQRTRLPDVWCEVRGQDGSTRAPGTFRPVRDLLAPLGYTPHRFVDGAAIAFEGDDAVGREDVLFRAAAT
jgi:FkbM family methyltransferase